MQQLRFPQDYVVPPATIDLAELKIGPDHSINHIYVLTLVQKYPQRYHNVKSWASTLPSPHITLWPGLLYEELSTEQHAEFDFTGDMWRDPRSTSIGFGHISIWRDAAAKGYQRILILEDDVIFCRDFVVRMNRLNDQLQQIKADVIYLSDGMVNTNFHVGHDDYQVAEGLFRRVKGDSRCGDSYIINAETLTRGLAVPYDRHIDHFLSLLGKDATVLWVEPNFITQGSMHGNFPR